MSLRRTGEASEKIAPEIKIKLAFANWMREFKFSMKINSLLSTIVNGASILAISAVAQAQVPPNLEYNGYLIEKNKAFTGSRDIEVKLFSVKTGGKALATEKIGPVKFDNGDFSFQYGSKAIAAKLTAQNSWLAIVVGGKEQSPRTQLLSVPFALKSGDAQQFAMLGANLASEVEDLNSTIEELNSTIAELKEQLAELQTQVKSIQDDHSTEDPDDGTDDGTDDGML